MSRPEPLRVLVDLFPLFGVFLTATIAYGQPPKAAPRYEVRVLHQLLPENARCAIACPKACEPTIVCTHDTLNRGPRGYGNERLVYRTSNARVSTWRLPHYEVALTYQLRRLLRQDYVRDSLIYGRFPAQYDHQAAVAWSQNSLLSAILLITPRRDSLLCLLTELMRGRIEDEGEVDPVINARRSGERTEATNSNYCFLLRVGRLTLVSDPDLNFYPQVQLHQAQLRGTLEYQILAAQRKGLIPQMKIRPSRQKSHLYIESCRFTTKGLSVIYGLIDDEFNKLPADGPAEATIPYSLLPAEIFSFPSPKP